MTELNLRDIDKRFARPDRPDVHALRDVSLHLPAGSCTGLIGKSGSGKSTLAGIASLNIEPDAGQIELDGQRLDGLHHKAIRALRHRIQLIYQNPRSALNPRYRVQQLLAEPLRVVQRCPAKDIPARASLLLRQVGMDRSILSRYPAHLSGGECQRIAIARAIACLPDVLIADEPSAALDVAAQAQVMNLLLELQGNLGLTVLIISHDLALVSNLCERIAVMDRGHLVELAPTATLMNRPEHPATRMLVEMVCSRPPTIGVPHHQA